MIARILPRSEWDRLLPTEAGPALEELKALDAQALVVEDEGVIRGCWMLFPMWHAECLWIAPEARGGGSVGRRLLTGMAKEAAARGVSRLWTGSTNADVTRLLEHIGAQKIPGDHFVFDIGG